MKIECMDIGMMSVRIDLEPLGGWELLGRLSSLSMVAHDCAISSVVCVLPRRLPTAVRSAAERFISFNRVLRTPGRGELSAAREEFGYYVLSHDAGFLLLRDSGNDGKYSIFAAAVESNVDLAARCAYLVTNVLGFTSLLSFEVRFGIYELLGNIVEHGVGGDFDQWVQLDLEKMGDKLSVSIVDKGAGFDPTGEDEFDLRSYIVSGKRRGLGLIMTRRLAEQMRFRREEGFNKIYFEKSMTRRNRNGSTKEDTMAQLTISEPRRLEDGFQLVTLDGDLDTKGSLVIEDLMNRFLEQGIHRVVLDFQKVPFISSAGVGILIGLVSSLHEAGGEVVLANVTPKVRSVLSLLNLDDFFKIMDPQRS